MRRAREYRRDVLVTVLVIVILMALFVWGVDADAQRPVYLTRAARSLPNDSTVERVVTYFDERTVFWLNAYLEGQRRELLESGVCLHIAQRMPPDGFKVDSLAPGTRVPSDTSVVSWRQVLFLCPEGGAWAPLHFHVITPALDSWLQANHLDGYIGEQCVVSPKDRSPYWARYPFSAMQCGLGVDSIIVYRVKNR